MGGLVDGKGGTAAAAGVRQAGRPTQWLKTLAETTSLQVHGQHCRPTGKVAGQ